MPPPFLSGGSGVHSGQLLGTIRVQQTPRLCKILDASQRQVGLVRSEVVKTHHHREARGCFSPAPAPLCCSEVLTGHAFPNAPAPPQLSRRQTPSCTAAWAGRLASREPTLQNQRLTGPSGDPGLGHRRGEGTHGADVQPGAFYLFKACGSHIAHHGLSLYRTIFFKCFLSVVRPTPQ